MFILFIIFIQFKNIYFNVSDIVANTCKIYDIKYMIYDQHEVNLSGCKCNI